MSHVYFSPGDACKQAIIQQISTAKQYLDICVFTISDDDISEAILAAYRRKIAVRILTDNDKLHDLGSDIERLAEFGLEIRIDNTPNHMHHKFMIADGKSVTSGSYNWTRSAAKFNHENIVVTDEAGVVAAFCQSIQ